MSEFSPEYIQQIAEAVAELISARLFPDGYSYPSRDTSGNRGFLGAELLQDLADKLAVQISSRAQVDADEAKRIAEEIAATVADDWGGQSIYIPKDDLARRSALHEQIWEKFTGDNQAELAAKFGLSVPGVYRILKRMTLLRRTPQRSLFEPFANPR